MVLFCIWCNSNKITSMCLFLCFFFLIYHFLYRIFFLVFATLPKNMSEGAGSFEIDFYIGRVNMKNDMKTYSILNLKTLGFSEDHSPESYFNF